MYVAMLGSSGPLCHKMRQPIHWWRHKPDSVRLHTQWGTYDAGPETRETAIRRFHRAKWPTR